MKNILLFLALFLCMASCTQLITRAIDIEATAWEQRVPASFKELK